MVKQRRGGYYKRQLSTTLNKKGTNQNAKEICTCRWCVLDRVYKRMPEAELKAENYTTCQSETM